MNRINENQIDDKLFNLYTLTEMTYQEHFKNNINEIDELYPFGWYENKNYKEKIEIITEAIRTNTLIANTESYQRIIEGVERKIKELVI